MEPRENDFRWTGRIVLAVSIVIAGFSAKPYAGSWNDGSRLATVESLVDHRTLAIDDSIFVQVPPLAPDKASPYPRDFELLQVYGTKDKIFVGGHFYSDKSPVPAFPMAAVYQVWLWCGGPTAAQAPDWFCLLIIWSSCGLAYVAAAWSFHAIGRRIGLPPGRNLAITLAFAIGTVAIPFAQQVNNHILLLAVAALLFQSLLNGIAEGWPRRRLLWIGFLAGLGYTIDLAAGPLLCLAAGGFLLGSPSRRGGLGWVILAALPLVLCHHIVNYEIGGSIGPANAVAAHFQWPGSPFSEQNITGGWHHSSLGKGLLYALDMLFGKRGFLGHNLLLFLPLLCLPALLRQRSPERGLLIAGLLWAVGTWLLYAATSNNLSGGCCSIRWFVPLLAPGFLGVCLVVRDWPETGRDAAILGTGGVILGAVMCIRGPWGVPHLTVYWIVYAGSLLTWGAAHLPMRSADCGIWNKVPRRLANMT